MADPGEGPGGPRPPPPLIFRPKGGPEGRKQIFGDRASPLSEGLDSPLITVPEEREKSHVIIQVVKCILIEFSSFQS